MKARGPIATRNKYHIKQYGIYFAMDESHPNTAPKAGKKSIAPYTAECVNNGKYLCQWLNTVDLIHVGATNVCGFSILEPVFQANFSSKQNAKCYQVKDWKVEWMSLVCRLGYI